MNKTNLFCLVVLAIIALIISLANIDFNSEKITGEYIETYLRSQDIDFDVKPRTHISDAHIYSASGFLYAMGSSPTEYNFQHPPFTKYLFGLSAILFGSPFWIQLVFGIILPILTLYLGLKTFKSIIASFVASLLLVLDPLYQELTKHTLLDLGQSVFAICYVIVAIYFVNLPIVAGIFLGLFAASKFWSSATIFFIAVEAFLFWKKKKIDTKRIVVTLTTSFLIFNLTYIASYINTEGFNIFFWQAKVAKFMIHHDVATEFGGSLVLFLTGGFNTWWSGEQARDIWSILWPASSIASLFLFMKHKSIDNKAFIFIFPILYIFSLVGQAPFSRYFILALPFFYLSLAYLLIKILRKII